MSLDCCWCSYKHTHTHTCPYSCRWWWWYLLLLIITIWSSWMNWMDGMKKMAIPTRVSFMFALCLLFDFWFKDFFFHLVRLVLCLCLCFIWLLLLLLLFFLYHSLLLLSFFVDDDDDDSIQSDWPLVFFLFGLLLLL